MKTKLLVAIALIGAALTLLSGPASASVDTSQTPDAAFSALKTAKAPSWQMAEVVHVKINHSEKDHCDAATCGKVQCYDQANRLWVCKAARDGDANSCNWHTIGVCNTKYKPSEDVTNKP